MSTKEWEPQYFMDTIVVSGVPPGNSKLSEWLDKCNALMQKGDEITGVLNLTNTKRYYSPDRLIKRDGSPMDYLHVSIPHGRAPTLAQWSECMNFIDLHRSKVAVHCTHGVHRTGAIVCAYACVRMEMTPQSSTRVFENMRRRCVKDCRVKDRKQLYEFIFKQHKISCEKG